MLRNFKYAVLLALLMLAGCSPSSKRIARILKNAAAEHTPLYGHQDDLMYGHSWNATEDGDGLLERSDIFSVTEDYPAVLGLDLGGIELGHSKNLDGNSFSLMCQAARKHYERGGIVTFSWHAANPVTGGDAWDVSDSEVLGKILGVQEYQDIFREWLDRVADYLILVDVPVIFRPWHEHSGAWFWWGAQCPADKFCELWTYTYDYLTEERGVKNLLWAISPNPAGGVFETWEERYPGDAYVDIVGLDCYATGRSREEYVAEVRSCLGSLQSFCERHDKILAFTETGDETIPDSHWWTKSLGPAMEGFPISYVLTWRNSSEPDKRGHYYAPFKNEHSADDFVKLNKNRQILLLNDIK